MRVIVFEDFFNFADLNFVMCFIFVGILFCNTILANTHICQHTHTHTHTHIRTTTTDDSF